MAVSITDISILFILASTSYTGGKLREARVGHYRLYFTIIEKTVEILKLVVILELGHKDEQIKLIDKLTSQLASKIAQAIEKLKLKSNP